MRSRSQELPSGADEEDSDHSRFGLKALWSLAAAAGCDAGKLWPCSCVASRAAVFAERRPECG